MPYPMEFANVITPVSPRHPGFRGLILIRFLTAFALILPGGAAETLSYQNERTWTGTNGKTFRGQWVDVEKETGRLVIFADRKTFRIDPANLSEADRKWIAPFQERTWTRTDGTTFVASWRHMSGEEMVFSKPGRGQLRVPVTGLSDADRRWLSERFHEMPGKVEDPFTSESMASLRVGDVSNFKTDPPLLRSSIPIINQSDYGRKTSDCVPSSFCNFLLWWDQHTYLPIDKRGDFDKKAEYIHSRVSRYFGTRNTAGTSMDDAEEGIRAYFEKDLKDIATFRILTDRDCSAENLRRYMNGVQATLLEVSVYYGRKDEGGHVVALADVEANGDLIIHTWGCKIRGKLKLLKPDVKARQGGRMINANHYEIEFMNPGDLPDWIGENEVRFEIDPSRSDGLTIVRPYRYAKPGKPSPPPADPLMEPPPARPIAP